MKKEIVKKDDRSLKTFLLYTFIVFFVILVSLSIKAVFVLKQSKFNGESLNIAISQNNRVIGILGFNPIKNTTSYLKIKNSNIPASSIGQNLGIIIDGNISSKYDISSENQDLMLAKAFIGKDSVKTDLTIFDIGRLIFFSKSVTSNNRRIEEVKWEINESDANKIIASMFRDDTLNAENVSIEIVNATDEQGLGKRLERCLTNAGANVVAVTTPHTPEATSRIQYIGSDNYTVEKLKKSLKFPGKKIDKKTIAKIVIIIGKDNKNKSIF